MFLDLALSHVARGLAVLPLKPRDKEPQVMGGCHAATKDEARICKWWTKWPDANIGIGGANSNKAVLDIDHGFTSWEDVEAWRMRNGLPETYTVRTGRRPGWGVQMYFDGVMDDVRSWAWDGCKGDVKSLGGLVVAAGSIHPDTGETYQVLRDVAFAPLPDSVRALKSQRVERAERAPGEKITEGRNNALVSAVGKFRSTNPGVSVDSTVAFMQQWNIEECAEPMSCDEVEECVRKQFRLYPDTEPTATVLIGRNKKEKATEVELIEELDPALKSTPLPKYPLDAFEDTVYMDFAKRAAKGNFVPLEFFVEGAMTYAGGIAALGVRHAQSEEITLRMFTVLLASAGIGKGTTFRRIRRFAPPSRVMDFVNLDRMTPKNCSVLVSRPASENGLNESLLQHPHVLLEFEEMDRLMEKTQIQGSGGALMSIIRTCFDDIRPGITTCKGREVAAEVAFLSILGAMTPSLWRRAMEGRDSYGSGLGGRFNLIASNEDRTASTLVQMDPGDLEEKLEALFRRLDVDSLVIDTEPDALKLLDEWWNDNSRGEPHYNRVNVIAHRKALHLAWLRGLPAINVELMRQALRLGDYLVGVRDVFAVSKGDDKTAVGENRVFHILRQIAPKAATAKQIVAFLDGTMSRASVFRALETLASAGEVEKIMRNGDGKPYGMFRVSLKEG